MYDTIDKILIKIEKEIKGSFKYLDNRKTNYFLDLIISSKRIFLTGMGRSDLISQSFSMRLMQLGFNAYHVGDSTTPSISKGDILVAISGSGSTKTVQLIIEEAKKQKAKIILITNKKSLSEKTKNKKIDLFLEINAKNKKQYGKISIEPLGTLFEQSSLIYLDAMVILLMKRLNLNEKDLGKKHSNLE
jgi:6-phospho-3-hexuloisomerase